MTKFFWLMCGVGLGCSSEEKSPCLDGFEADGSGNCVPVESDEPSPDGEADAPPPPDSDVDADADGGADTDGGADADGSDDGGGGGDIDPLALSNCDEPLGGIDWGITPPDARGGFAGELAALDLTTLPDDIDVSGLDDWERGWVAYAMEISAADLGASIRRDDAMAAGIMGQVLLGSLMTDGGGMDQSFFRRGLYRYYVCSRGYPVTLEGFKELIGYPTDFIEVESIVKCGPRMKGEDWENGIFVAEAIGTEHGETEILLTGRRADNALEFLVYGPDGRLTNRSPFPVSEDRPVAVMPTPWVCMTCHSGTLEETNSYSFDPDLLEEVLIPAFGNICY